jgi:hypothetical protein
MSAFLSILSNVIIFAITPLAVVWASKKINPHLSQMFPLTEEEKTKIRSLSLLSDKSQSETDKSQSEKQGHYEIFQIWILMFVMLPLFIGLIYLPIAGSRGGNTLMAFNMEINGLKYILPAGFLAISLSVYAADYSINYIYKLFNPKEDLSGLYYTSLLKQDISYDVKAASKAFFKVSLLMYAFFAYWAFSSIDVLTRTHYIDKGFFTNENYEIKALDFKLYPNKNTTFLQIKLKGSNDILLDDSTQEGALEELKSFLKLRKLN